MYLESLILIHAHAECLAILPTSTPFVALSYVWGRVTVFKTLKSNVETDAGFRNG